MPDQIPEPVKTVRSDRLLGLNRKNQSAYQKRLIGTCAEVLMEESCTIDGKKCQVGHTREYVRVAVESAVSLSNQLVRVRVEKEADEQTLYGVVV
jgi:threonylcarbamoyladenosine tRNA methylthiotransferase MtaB